MAPIKERTASSPAQMNPTFLAGAGKFEKTRHKFMSVDESFIYHLSVIDYLQDYNSDKFLEHQFKALLNKKENHNLISAVDPSTYRNRFVNFMRDKVIVDVTKMAHDDKAAKRKNSSSDDER
jgi:hypothetical protein